VGGREAARNRRATATEEDEGSLTFQHNPRLYFRFEPA
jgi:hypothetical protein